MRQIKIGLALGAGSAKGWAHIGVINALKKLGIEVDIVAGCSVGALVGAAFASHRLPAMEQWVRSFSYWDVIRLMDFSRQRGGLLRGDRVFNAVGQLLKINDIAECALKFGAVTTNLSTGRELWLTEGDIHQAVRASCSMPACWRRCGPTAIGCWMARWSIRCRCPFAGRWGRYRHRGRSAA